MVRSFVLLAAAVVMVLAAALALAWWWLLFGRIDHFPREDAGTVTLFLLGFAAAQTIAMLLAIRQLARAHRTPRPLYAWVALAAALLLFGSGAITFFTPVAGAPVLALAAFSSFGGTPREGPSETGPGHRSPS